MKLINNTKKIELSSFTQNNNIFYITVDTSYGLYGIYIFESIVKENCPTIIKIMQLFKNDDAGTMMEYNLSNIKKYKFCHIDDINFKLSFINSQFKENNDCSLKDNKISISSREITRKLVNVRSHIYDSLNAIDYKTLFCIIVDKNSNEKHIDLFYKENNLSFYRIQNSIPVSLKKEEIIETYFNYYSIEKCEISFIDKIIVDSVSFTESNNPFCITK